MGLLLMILHVAHSTPVTFVFAARLGKGVGGHTPRPFSSFHSLFQGLLDLRFILNPAAEADLELGVDAPRPVFFSWSNLGIVHARQALI